MWEKREMEGNMRFLKRKTREEGVFGARGLRGSFKGKILTLFSLSFLKFLLIISSWICYFEIWVIWFVFD
jgi:hypothetical protein